jgi:hypothetical protein
MDQAYSADKSWRSFWLVLLALFAGALAAGALASCGTAAHAGTVATPRDCGTVQIQVGRISDSAAAAQAENCFYQAYKICQPATLNVSEMGVDAGVQRTFTLAPNGGGCAISDSVHRYVVPNHDETQAYTCGAVAQSSDGLAFSACGNDGDVTVPASGSAQD